MMETFSPCQSGHVSPTESAPFTMVDVKFESGAEEAEGPVTSPVREREGSTEENTNKRKRNIISS